MLHEAGVPPGVLAFLPGIGEEVGADSSRTPTVAFVAFTGSKAVGFQIVERAAVVRPGQRHVKHVVAEMGGKNPVVVDTDADLDVAVPAITQSAFSYAGQKCSAASRVIAVDPVFDELVERLAGAAAIVPVGPAAELRTVCGPLIDDDAHERVRRYQSIAPQEGDVVIERDDTPDGGWYVGPTVVVTDDARLAARDRRDLRPRAHGAARRRLRPRARARERHRLRADGRAVLTLTVADRPGHRARSAPATST